MNRLINANIINFKGTKELNLKNFSNVNIIVGENNTGKTSVLEALSILKNPEDFTNILQISRFRKNIYNDHKSTLFDDFINLFPKQSNNSLEIALTCNYIDNEKQNNKILNYELIGTLQNIMFDINENDQNDLNKYNYLNEDIEQFNGKIITTINNETHIHLIKLNNLSKLTGRECLTTNFLNINYIRDLAIHIDVINDIIKDEKFKYECISILQLFDKNIKDILYIRNIQNELIEYIRDEKLGLVPLINYGDGLNQFLYIINSILKSKDGILLIDNFNLTLDNKTNKAVIDFIANTLIKYNVQLFFTTNNLELIDCFLNTQIINESYNSIDDPIRIITLRKTNEDNITYCRILYGYDVYNNRVTFNFDVRQ